MQEIRKDGKKLWVRVTVSPRLTEEGEIVGLLGVGEDITPRKELEVAARDTRETLESILSELSDVVYSVSVADGSLLHLNAAAEVLYGLPLAALRRNPAFWLDAVHPDDRPLLTNAVAELMATGAKEWTYRIVRPDGEIRWVYNRGRVVRDRTGKPFRIDCLLTDITHRKEAEDRLQASLHEKELLLKEIHHRVKNNLTTVSSLLSLQEQHSQGKAVGEILREAMSRIRSMGLIHERLYQSPRLSEIDAADYFRSLSAELVRVYGHGNVRLEIDADPFPLDIDSAIPCGLLINELLTNAIKYAFPDGRRGVIRIKLSPLPPTGFELEVSDDGVGFPPGLDPASVDSLGLSLVQLLTSQLNGTLVFSPGPGVSAHLTVRALRKKVR
jgi:PAS domain S-box-containing protein